jgi:hypothetical protein
VRDVGAERLVDVANPRLGGDVDDVDPSLENAEGEIQLKECRDVWKEEMLSEARMKEGCCEVRFEANQRRCRGWIKLE